MEYQTALLLSILKILGKTDEEIKDVFLVYTESLKVLLASALSKSLTQDQLKKISDKSISIEELAKSLSDDEKKKISQDAGINKFFNDFVNKLLASESAEKKVQVKVFLDKVKANKLKLNVKDEDIHTKVENLLVEIIGDAGKKLTLPVRAMKQDLATFRCWGR